MLTEEMRRVLGIFARWITVIAVFVLLGMIGILHLMLLLVLFIVQEVNKGLVWLGEPTQQGFDAYWSQMWIFWLVFYIGFFIFFALFYFLYWKVKRPDLMIGGVRDGRVLWVKGVRKGLVYDCWDAWNYLRGPDSPFVRGLRMRNSNPGMGAGPGMLQDPLKIPLGRRTTRRIVYFSRPWRLRVNRLLLQKNTKMVRTHGKLALPAGYIVNLEDPLLPGARVLVWVNDRPEFTEHDPDEQQEALEVTLEVAKGNVRGSVAANPSIITTEYQEGSVGKV